MKKIHHWMEENMALQKASNNENFNLSRMPYWKEIINAIGDSDTKYVSVMSATQMGKTSIMLSCIAYHIDNELAGQLMVLPTEHHIYHLIRKRLEPMFASYPSTGEKLRRIDFATRRYKGGHLAISGADFKSDLALTIPIEILYMDERDRYPKLKGMNGDFAEVFLNSPTYHENTKKIIRMSTPAVFDKESKIASDFYWSSMEEWNVKCPCCGEWQVYDFKRVVMSASLKSDAAMKCIQCKKAISEPQWKQSEHKWIAGFPDRKRSRGFHLSQLAHPDIRWIDIILWYKKAYKKWEDTGDDIDMRIFANCVLGIPKLTI